MTEEYFPRGGKKPNVTYFKQSSNFLGAAEKGQGKKKKQKKRTENDDGYLSDEAVKDVDQSYKMCAVSIGHKTLKPGVNILGRVARTMETKLVVSLPSKLRGSVMACHISEPYNKVLEAYVNDEREQVRELPAMFRPGQYVALQVLESGTEVMLSAMPQHVNSGRTHSDLLKGDILQAAVSSVEDHGYVMDIGVPHTRAFLPKGDANPDIELDTGVLAWTCVKSVTVSPGNSIVALSGALPALQRALRRKRGALLPGAAVEFIVDKPLDNGIEGHVFSDTTAYIQRFHADNVKGKKPALGQKIRAHVLYVMPTRNAPFLTMKNIFETSVPDLETEMKFKEGDIIDEAQVLKITGRSIHFKLGRKCVGTMSLKRVAVDEDLSDEQIIAKSYPIGSTHRVRVLIYNLSDYVYHVSDESSVLEERYFSLEALRPGQLVAGRVLSVADTQVIVTLGRLRGFVPHTHLTDAGIYIDPKRATTTKISKKKYKEGQEVTARVLTVDPFRLRLHLTLKPTLLSPELVALAAYEEAEVGKAYTGVVKFIKDFLLVSFFGDVVAYVPRGEVARPPPDNLRDAFHLGQIVSCTILHVDPEKKRMLGTLVTPPFWPAKRRDELTKRRKGTDDNEAPKKKLKTEHNTADTEVKNKKKDKKSKNKIDDDADEGKGRVNEVSEESDAIETDIHEDSDQALTPGDKALIDLSDCSRSKEWKKRIAALQTSIKCRLKRIEKINKKILSLEESGLTAKNKKYHTAMHQDKLSVEERMKKLEDALKTALEQLRKIDPEYVKKMKKAEKQKLKAESKKTLKKAEGETIDKEKVKEIVQKKKKKKLKEAAKIEENAEKEVKESPKKDKENKRKVKKGEEVKEVVDKSKDIKVVESLEPALEMPSAKEFWSENADNLAKTAKEDTSSSSEDEETEAPKKKRKKLSAAEKVAKARAEEERLRELERRAASSDAEPRSSDQFERALLASPNCSQLWIAYMAFHLQATEIDKARAVARKALNTISFREEQEKLNVWLALLNLENRFGTKESQQKTLEDALQMNDTFKIHSKLLDIYADTAKSQELSALVDLMLRKYKRDPRNYTLCGAACYRLGLLDKARHVMQKAVAVLEKKEHVSVLVQFALLERAHGERERAEALFEQVLAVYPQRVDVCATYVDMLMKTGDVQAVRQVMERMTSQKLPARKIKVLFNKWAEVEERAGDVAQAEQIRQRAVEYIEKAKF
ncbi:rRNA biogenesis protein RRP5-like [Choristoneura fumiferana]|uniref:rRNA biogenesis protein RRP5-like n=1 Tax=Choristoneura fumiferana TaxID=7141 RepID=UPI003D15DEB4